MSAFSLRGAKWSTPSSLRRLRYYCRDSWICGSEERSWRRSSIRSRRSSSHRFRIPSGPRCISGIDLISRVAVPFIDATVFVLPWDTDVSLEGGLSWELSSIAQGWWYLDDPDASVASQIGPGPQAGQGLGTPHYLIADALFLQGSWGWLMFA